MKRFWKWLMYDCELKPGLRMDREIYLAIVAASSENPDARSILWSYLKNVVGFQDALILINREQTPEQWKKRLLEYQKR